ncbi:hypothetical protein [Paenibacillus sp. FSL R7-0331]|uniref:hypothetical protein n=1 Tax=Paenibacillus sp. FSL R7-0331 TaxID=1536773 RepID=UPI0004F60A03|nr:hypothetical protein [Paenibacillus sp. FSL R7-0331]AIQ52940.1 hypothetical protein R70331_16360 [Paenibacillus sp. FSL R7-0331]
MNSNTNISESQEEVILGARALGEQVYKIMPTYDLLLEQLKEIRSTAAKQAFKKQSRCYENDKQDFNNTVGIFGPRGTGKSSALYTLRNYLSKDTMNILLPLIEPDNFGENTKIIGSIVGLLCEEGKKLLKQLHLLKNEMNVPDDLSFYFNNGVLKPNNPLKQIIDETIEYHLYTEPQYRDMLGQNYADLATHIRKSERLLIPDIEFKKKLMILIDTIVHVKKALMTHEPSDKCDRGIDECKSQVALIYIFIDDIDLKTSKTRELMEALLQYTNHPHIVTVLSGDYEILTESLTLALLQDEPLKELGLGAYESLKVLDKDSEQESDKEGKLTILKRKTNLAHEYLKKIIPPASRHQLVKWNENTIPYFTFGNNTLLDQLTCVFGNWSLFSYQDEEANKAINKPIKRSYIIFDEKPRGIVNAYYHLNQLIKAKQNGQANNPDKFFQLAKAFIDTLISSNTKLLLHQELVFGKFIIWGSEAKSSFIHYAMLHDLIYPYGMFKEIDDLKVALYVIGELVTYLLPRVNYDQIHYSIWRKEVMDQLLFKPNEIRGNSGQAIDERYLKYNQNSDYRLFFLVETLAIFAHTEISALLSELISNINLDLYYKSRWASEDAQAKDEYVIGVIHTLLLQEEMMLSFKRQERGNSGENALTIFDKLYYQAYSNQDDINSKLANFSLNLLDSLCAETAEVIIAERQFKLLMNEWDAVLDKKQNELKKPATNMEHQKNRLNEFIDLQIKRSLFLNSTIAIKNKAVVLKKSELKSTDIGYTLSVINGNKKNSGNSAKVPDAIYSTLENRMKKFAKDILIKFSGDDKSVELKDIDDKEARIFMEAPAGINNTRFNYAKSAFEPIFYSRSHINFTTYSFGFRTIEKLSQNNKVYYGRPEAIAFLPKLKKASRFSDEEFSEQESYTIHQYAKYVGANEVETKMDAYENAKKFIQRKLHEAHNRFQSKTLADIKGYNLKLEDLEIEELAEQNNTKLRLHQILWEDKRNEIKENPGDPTND